MKLDISAEAEADLEAIGDHIAQDNPSRAISFINELYATCLTLTDFPERFPLAPRYAATGVRRCLHGNYLIFYRIEPDRIVVIHVLHGASDYGSVLF